MDLILAVVLFALMGWLTKNIKFDFDLF